MTTVSVVLQRLQRIALPAAAVAITLSFVSMTRADPDLWGHVRFGAQILDTGVIRLADSYSFTSDRPWINHEWLAEVIMAAAYGAVGAAGLVLLKMCVIGLSLVCLWHIVRADGAGRRAAVMLTALALAGILSRVQAVRPQLFSVLCFSVLMLILRRAEVRPALLWLAVPLLSFWANTHGGWLVGCGTLLMWCAVRSAVQGPAGIRRAAQYWTAAAAAVAATLITPYGLELWFFLYGTVGTFRRYIGEWGPITEGASVVGVWLGYWALVILALRRGGRSSWPSAAVPLFWGVASLKVSRLDAFFALSTIAMLAPFLIPLFERQRAEHPAQPAAARSAFVTVVATGILIVAAPWLWQNSTCIDVHAGTVPEAQAVAFIGERHLAGRMVTFFDWGEYAIWHLPGTLRVSMDGRRETVYSDAHFDGHLDMYLASPKGLAYLDSLAADYVWVPIQLPLANHLAASASWATVFRGERSIIFGRRGLVTPAAVREDGEADSCRCFPGP